MQIKVFTIPILGGTALENDMNLFLRSKKVLQVKEHLVNNEAEGVFWCFCVRYVDDITATERERIKIDYKEVLDDASFNRFSKLREIRKRIANEEKIGAYIIFTDAELAEMAKLDPITPDGIKGIKGIGEKKFEKYGHFFIPLPSDETGK